MDNPTDEPDSKIGNAFASDESVEASAEVVQSSIEVPPKPPEEEPSQLSLWLTRNDQFFLGIAVLVMVVLFGWRWYSSIHTPNEPVEIEHLEKQKLNYRIDINTATRIEWMQLEGIGETLADRIIADREENGPFASIEDLERVKGIGPKILARIRRHLIVKPVSQQNRE
ncbi:MAG: hypothetical protein Tsb009_38700 [Planctomycetaceae bacterium]